MLVHHRFICNVADSPHTVAISQRDQNITRKQLNQWSNAICNYLLVNEISGTIPLVVPKSIGCIIAILGVLKAGCSYVLFHSDSKLLDDYEHILLSPRISIKKRTNAHYITNELLQNDLDGYLRRPVRVDDFAYRIYTNHSRTDITHSAIIDFFNDWKQYFTYQDQFERNLLDDDWNGHVLYCLFYGKTIYIDDYSTKTIQQVEMIPYGSSFVESIFVKGVTILPRKGYRYKIADHDYKMLKNGFGTIVVEQGSSRWYTKLSGEGGAVVRYCKNPQLQVKTSFFGFEKFFF